MASRLIALDKCPGVRPIGIGECLRRLMGKAVMLIAGEDVKRVCGADQLSAGIEVGIEAAVHAVNELFDEHQGTAWGVLQVDASNAFNSLNRKVALWHARRLWPRGCRYLFNTYKAWATLVVSGSSSAVLYSREGTTQGDPLSMAFYALGVLPLIVQLKDLDKWIQIWYADDANNCGKLPLLRERFDMLVTKGPDFGYFPKPSKSILVVAECDIPEAERLFSDIGIQICTSSRILGGRVGSSTGRKEYIQQKVLSWVHHVDCLAEAAGSQPQDAYVALTKSLSFEWTFVQRVVQECGDLSSSNRSRRLFATSFCLSYLAVSSLPRIVLFSWREMPVISRQIGLRHDRNEFRQKNQKKMAQANTRLSSLELEEPRSPSSRTIM